VGLDATTATATSPRAPSAAAWKTAVRSAHIDRPYDAFSMFAPVKVLPSSASSAAPTVKPLYGA
jgi:hypothetical protein